MKILACYNIKGGVGKTAAAVNLSYCAAESGARVLVWDLDPQGATSYYFRVKPKVKGGGRKLLLGKQRLDNLIKGTDYPTLDLLPSDFSYRRFDFVLDGGKKPERRLKHLLLPLADDYDYVFLDCAPGISLISEAVFGAVDALVVPLIPTTLSVRTYEQLLKFLARKQISGAPVMPFFSLVDWRKTMHRDLTLRMRAEPTGMLQTTIPNATEVERMGVYRAPVCAYAARSPASQAYMELWREISDRLNDRQVRKIA